MYRIGLSVRVQDYSSRNMQMCTNLVANMCQNCSVFGAIEGHRVDHRVGHRVGHRVIYALF